MEQELAKYERLKMTIDVHIKVYKELLNDYETELKRYLKQDIPQSLIDVQQILISKAKAKISALEELNH